MKWLDRAKVYWRRSNGRCAISVVRDPQDARRRIHVVEQCGRSVGTWVPSASIRSVAEAVAIAEKAIPRSEIHPNTLRIEPRRRGGMIIEETDHYIGDRHVDTQKLSGAKRRRR